MLIYSAFEAEWRAELRAEVAANGLPRAEDDARWDELNEAIKRERPGFSRWLSLHPVRVVLLRRISEEMCPSGDPARGRGGPLSPRADPRARLHSALHFPSPPERNALSRDGPSSAPDRTGTGLTWLAVEGTPNTEIRDIAGHTQTSMTDRYMRAAGILRGGRFGQPFPTLPPRPGEFRIGFRRFGQIPSIFTEKTSGADGTRTRGLRRDRPAL